MKLKALTIIQPFAELIARGEKRVENRVWHTNYRGPLAIHAGKATRYNGDSVYELAEHYGISRNEIILGAIIANGELVDCVQLEDSPLGLIVPDWATKKYPWLDVHAHTEGPYCFILENVKRLDMPFRIAGKQKLWDLEIEV